MFGFSSYNVQEGYLTAGKTVFSEGAEASKLGSYFFKFILWVFPLSVGLWVPKLPHSAGL